MAVVCYVDGSQVAHVGGSVTRRLNRPSEGTMRVPQHLSFGGAGSRCKIVIDGVLALHGRCTFVETVGDEDTGYTTYNVTDPMELWDSRLATDDTGDWSNPQFMYTVKYGPQVMEQLLNQTIADDGPIDAQPGYFAPNGPSLEGAPLDWPSTIAEVATLLVSTGQLDIVADPIDSGGNMAQINCYNGNYGTDRSASLSFDFGLGAYNVRQVRWTADLGPVTNKLWYLLGPRVKLPRDPGAVQHWRANVQGDDPGLANPPKSAVIARRDASRVDFQTRMEVQIFDASGTEGTIERDLYRWNWLAEQWMRAYPLELINITPIRGLAYGSFREGDVVAVRATTALRGGFSGAMRVYEYTATWDQDSVVAITELQTSPGNEGF
jgi:hypothetical protein